MEYKSRKWRREVKHFLVHYCNFDKNLMVYSLSFFSPFMQGMYKRTVRDLEDGELDLLGCEMFIHCMLGPEMASTFWTMCFPTLNSFSDTISEILKNMQCISFGEQEEHSSTILAFERDIWSSVFVLTKKLAWFLYCLEVLNSRWHWSKAIRKETAVLPNKMSFTRPLKKAEKKRVLTEKFLSDWLD